MSALFNDLLSRLQNVKKTSSGWTAKCPAHSDDSPSLSIGVGDDGKALLHCHAGCSIDAVTAAIRLTPAALMANNGDRTSKNPQELEVSSPVKGNRKKTYRNMADAGKAALWSMGANRMSKGWKYFNAEWQMVGAVLRCDLPNGGKEIRPIALMPDGWVVGAMPRPRPLYRLPALAEEKRILIVEGEKAADAGCKLGLVCTTSAGGAQAAHQSDWSPVAGAETIFILPDNDKAGQTYAEDVVLQLVSLHCKATILVVELPELPEGGDLFDWVQSRSGKSDEELRSELDVLLAQGKPADVEKAQWLLARPDDEAAIDEESRESDEGPREFVPFPTDLLPEPVASFVHAASTAMGCDESYVALPMLAALSAAVGNSRRVQLKRSWCEPCVVWAVIVGESGTLKSPALDIALASLRSLQADAWRKFREKHDQYEVERQIYEAEYSAWKSKGRKNGESPPNEPDEPVCHRLVAEDTTVEALALLLNDNPRGILVARDELSGWLNSFDAYKSARGGDVAHWLTMHRAGSCLVDRKTGRQTIRVPHAAVSVTGGVQPQTFAAALAGRYQQREPEDSDKAPPREHFDNGLAARLLLSMPPRLPKLWTDDDIDPSMLAKMDSLFDKLTALEMIVDENNEPQPIDVPLSLDAKRLFVRFYNDHAIEQCELESDLAAAWSKLEGYAARFALLFYLVRRVCGDPKLNGSPEVDAKSMADGIELVRWFGDEAARIYHELGGCEDTEEARQKREDSRLVAWIREHDGRISARDLTRGPRQFRGDGTAAEKALTALVEAGRGQWEDVPAGDQGGRPTRVFFLTESGSESATYSPATSGDGDETTGSPIETDVSSPSPPQVDAEAEEGEWTG